MEMMGSWGRLLEELSRVTTSFQVIAAAGVDEWTPYQRDFAKMPKFAEIEGIYVSIQSLFAELRTEIRWKVWISILMAIVGQSDTI